MSLKRLLSTVLSSSLLFATVPGAVANQTSQPVSQPVTAFVKQASEQLQQLVVPIAVHREDFQPRLVRNLASIVARLAASTTKVHLLSLAGRATVAVSMAAVNFTAAWEAVMKYL